jgi:hypothetical protein
MTDKKLAIEESIRANQILEDADKVRKAGLYNTTVDGKDIRSAGPGQLDSGIYKHSLDGKEKNFDQKIFMFPESYNQLRKELVENWPNLWALVAWRMANRAEEFVEIMNDALDVAVVFDTEAVDFICSTYLSLLRKKRGLSQ